MWLVDQRGFVLGASLACFDLFFFYIFLSPIGPLLCGFALLNLCFGFVPPLPSVGVNPASYPCVVFASSLFFITVLPMVGWLSSMLVNYNMQIEICLFFVYQRFN